MAEPSQESFFRWLVGAVAGGVVGSGGLIGYFKYRLARSRVPASNALTIAQAEVQSATAEKIRSEAEGSLLDRMSAYCDRVETRLKEEHLRVIELEAQVKAERERADKAQAQVDLFEDQMRKVKAVLEVNNLEFPN